MSDKSRTKHLTLNIFLFLILIDLLEAFAQFCYKKSALVQDHISISTFNELIEFASNSIHSPFLWIGCGVVSVIFVIWSTILTKVDLSVAVPANSFNFISVPVVAVLFLHEHVSLLRWVGFGIILVGVYLVSKSTKETL